MRSVVELMHGPQTISDKAKSDKFFVELLEHYSDNSFHSLREHNMFKENLLPEAVVPTSFLSSEMFCDLA